MLNYFIVKELSNYINDNVNVILLNETQYASIVTLELQAEVSCDFETLFIYIGMKTIKR